VGDAGERHVAQLPRLLRERLDQTRVLVTEQRAPPRRVRIQVRATVHVHEARALRALQDERLRALQVVLHLGVGVPDVSAVVAQDLFAEGHARSSCT